MSLVLKHCFESSALWQYLVLEKTKYGENFKSSIAYKIAQGHGLLEKLELEMKKAGKK